MADSVEKEDFHPVTVARPPYLHRYDLYSPKLTRRLTLFSWNSVLLWTMIESHAAIKKFCERPGSIRIDCDWRLADFWVQRDGQSEFVLLEHSPLKDTAEATPRLESDLGLRTRTVLDAELGANAVWIKNWQQTWFCRNKAVVIGLLAGR